MAFDSIKKYWLFSDIPYRPSNSTYLGFSYEDLPSLPTEKFKGNFNWLVADDEAREYLMDEYEHLKFLEKEVEKYGFVLPNVFKTFMGNKTLRSTPQSCTDNYFELSACIDWFPEKENEWLIIRFYSDSQSCAHWYLCVDKEGNHAVLSSFLLYGIGRKEQAECNKEIPKGERKNYFAYAAPDFESFIYRVWIENEIWFKCNWDKQKLSKEEQAYLNHYIELNQKKQEPKQETL